MFKDIPGYDGKYQINLHGEVKRIYKRTTAIIKPATRRGKLVIRLMAPDGKRKTELVHKLMQRTFMRPPKPGEVLYHKNGDKLDPWINNLVYISSDELGKLTGARARRRPVAKLDKKREVVELYPSARQAAKDNSISYNAILNYCNGKRKNYAPDGFFYVWEENLIYPRK